MLTISERFSGSPRLPQPLCNNTASLNSATHTLTSVSYNVHTTKGSKSFSKPIKFFLSTKVSAAVCNSLTRLPSLCKLENCGSTSQVQQWGCWSGLCVLPPHRQLLQCRLPTAALTSAKSTHTGTEQVGELLGEQLIKVLRNEMRLDLRSCITQRVLLNYWQRKAL